MRLRLLCTAALLGMISSSAWAAAPSCQAYMDAYEDLRANDTSLPQLFSKKFAFDDLNPLQIGDVVLDDRMEQTQLAVKNHIGYLDCSPGGDFAVLDMCAALVSRDSDPFLEERFQVTSTALLDALKSVAGSTKGNIEHMIGAASDDLKAALVRGDTYPQGGSEVEIAPNLYAKIFTVPNIQGFRQAEMCFMAEYFVE